MKYVLSLLVLLMTFISCSKPSNELNEDDLKFAAIMVDVYLVNGLSNQVTTGSKDSVRTALTVEVLKKHDMDTTTFYNTLSGMEGNPHKVKILYDTVVSRLEKLRPL